MFCQYKESKTTLETITLLKTLQPTAEILIPVKKQKISTVFYFNQSNISIHCFKLKN